MHGSQDTYTLAVLYACSFAYIKTTQRVVRDPSSARCQELWKNYLFERIEVTRMWCTHGGSKKGRLNGEAELALLSLAACVCVILGIVAMGIHLPITPLSRSLS